MVQFQRNTPEYMEYRRALRQLATKSERVLWKYIKSNQLGVKCRRQVSVGSYIVDFYCHEKKLIIELDGYTHQGDVAVQKDNAKQAYLQNNGYHVLRFTDEQVLDSIEVVLGQIKKALHE